MQVAILSSEYLDSDFLWYHREFWSLGDTSFGSIFPDSSAQNLARTHMLVLASVISQSIMIHCLSWFCPSMRLRLRFLLSAGLLAKSSSLQGAHPMIRQSRGDEDLDLLVLFMISFVVIGSEFAE
jgi:hypothetical protein